jgi:outer membrane protein assembly factor BamB
MFCYDMDGKELWKKDLGKLEHIWGNASSPIIYGDLAILWCGPGDRQFLLAVNKKTGDTVWETPVPGGKFGKDPKDWLGSWSTPIIIRVEDHDELIVGVPRQLKGLDPKTGKELWSCDGLGPLVYTSPVYADGIIVQMSGYGGPALACRTGGKGDVTKTYRLWHQAGGNPQRIGSGAIVGGNLYILNEPGIAQCLDIKTGKDQWQRERVNSVKPWASMVAAEGRLYVTDQAGDTFVFKADPKFEQVASNSLGEQVLGSIAVSNGEMFIRSYKHLWCIAEKK